MNLYRMEEYIYKVVPVNRNLRVDAKGSHGQTAQFYQDKINENAAGGWQLDQITSITSEIPAGCLSGLLGGQSETKTINMLIFKKRK